MAGEQAHVHLAVRSKNSGHVTPILVSVIFYRENKQHKRIFEESFISTMYNHMNP